MRSLDPDADCSKRTPNFHRRFLYRLGLVLALLACQPSNGRAAELDEYDLKALYLYHFTQFVTWPNGVSTFRDRVTTIGVIGNNPFGNRLQQLTEQQSQEAAPVRIAYFDSPEQAVNCQILFISQSERRNLGRILNAVRNLPILTVGDDDSFAPRGCVIGFARHGDTVGIIVNEAAAERARLELSSKLLRIAEGSNR